jgi:23S rRNA (cytidine2498-2'-O)-methyltransferase
MKSHAQGATVLVSFAEEYFAAASQEIMAVFPDAAVERLGPDLAGVTLPRGGIDDLVRAVRDSPLVFVKHLSEEMARIPLAAAEISAAARAGRSVLDGRLAAGDPIAVQCWVSGEAPTGFGSADLFRGIADELAAHGHPAVRTGTDLVLSGCIHRGGISLGLATKEQALSDWPGGRVRLARARDSVSRAEFKLEELLRTTGIRFPGRGRAVDLGAAPGGWTRILRECGLEVWSVDPAGLAPRLTADPLVHHERTTTGRFFRATSLRFDLVVNDMRMTPRLSCETMLDAAQVLNPGALGVVTLKLGPKNPGRTVRSCLDLLGQRYRVLVARQLHHNRHEVSVVLRASPERDWRPATPSR